MQALKHPMHGNEHGNSMLAVKCTVRAVSLASAVAPRGEGTGPGRVRNGRAGGAVEAVRPSRGPGEAATGPPAEGGTCVRAMGPFLRPAGSLARVVLSELVRSFRIVRSLVPYGTLPAVDSGWGTNRARRPPQRSLRRAYRGY